MCAHWCNNIYSNPNAIVLCYAMNDSYSQKKERKKEMYLDSIEMRDCVKYVLVFVCVHACVYVLYMHVVWQRKMKVYL